MTSSEPYIGQRRSYSGALCTIRYIGPLPNTKGDWLGVEWDNVSRGKHDGQYEGKRIFQCLSSSPTAASFIRSSRKPDPERTLLEAIKFKYAAATESAQGGSSSTSIDSTIEISGKIVEEVGFEKIQKQLSVLANLKIVLVDELVVSGIAQRGASRAGIETAQVELARTCPNIVELDIGWNIIETWQDVVDICVPLKKLKILKTSGLRLRMFENNYIDGTEPPFTTIEELQLNESLIRPAQVLQILSSAGSDAVLSLKTLSLGLNELETFQDIAGSSRSLTYPSVTTVNLDNNKFTNLSSLSTLMSLFPNITTLSLQGNSISHLGLQPSETTGRHHFEKLETLNLAGNQISDYSFVDALSTLFPNLSSLRISRNPLYDQAVSSLTDIGYSKARPSAPASDSRAYYLTLARIPHLKLLNHTNITPRDREEGEIYYLSVAEREIRQLLSDSRELSEGSNPPTAEEKVKLARQQHPLYSALCVQHDRDDILEHFLQQSKRTPGNSAPSARSELDSYGPGTLGSRLVDTYFYIHHDSSWGHEDTTDTRMSTSQPPTSFRRYLPSTVSVYRLKSLVAKQFNLPALQFKLVYESHEYDPVEPISRSTGMDGGKEDWDAWGDWDVDDGNDDHVHPSGSHGEFQNGAGNHSAADGKHGGHGLGSHPTLGAQTHEAHTENAPMYIIRDGQRFKKRETEILDGMRPWGDFLDLDSPDGTRRRDARIRIEPFLSVPY
ncbi:hypothetical protein A1O1_06583 [Capronia coronata CBS 617.96]|uniref:CAP-Gly domain-containing protein n=1 Tax=Capronia coronata CBS 617.96 TaxID=1182541 RepID=W9Y146_9EURO|nr:uncharacterized protein A1O1_06583 [Capronia coronata CBS 617.96]EXJ86213.1 hypothetical protein A1O1_06583 [Capronia coronata CBS 617.96]